MSAVKYRRPLNKNQIHIINLLYKFRYINTNQFANYLNLNPRIINERLKILLDQDFIDRFYDNSFKLKGKPAIYYLRPKSLAFLKTKDYYNHHATFIHYRNKRTNMTQINHYLKVFDIFQELKKKYNDGYKFITKTELAKKLEDNVFLADILIIKPSKEQIGVLYISNSLKNRNINTYIQNIIDSYNFNRLIIYFDNPRITKLLNQLQYSYTDTLSINKLSSN
jgi:hypothetical protein